MKEFKIGDRVTHRIYGKGTIELVRSFNINNKNILIKFDSKHHHLHAAATQTARDFIVRENNKYYWADPSAVVLMNNTIETNHSSSHVYIAISWEIGPRILGVYNSRESANKAAERSRKVNSSEISVLKFRIKGEPK